MKPKTGALGRSLESASDRTKGDPRRKPADTLARRDHGCHPSRAPAEASGTMWSLPKGLDSSHAAPENGAQGRGSEQAAASRTPGGRGGEGPQAPHTANVPSAT